MEEKKSNKKLNLRLYVLVGSVIFIAFIGSVFFLRGETLKGLVGQLFQGQLRVETEEEVVEDEFTVSSLKEELNKPDLQVERVYLTKKSDPTAGDPNYNFLADVKIVNNGEDITDEPVDLKFGDNVMDVTNNGGNLSLIQGESYTVTGLPLSVSRDLETRNVQFTVDNSNNVDETNENNNTLFKEISTISTYPELFFDIAINEISEDYKMTFEFLEPDFTISDFEVRHYVTTEEIPSDSIKKSVKFGETDIEYFVFEPNETVLTQFSSFEGVSLDDFDLRDRNEVFKRILEFYDKKTYVVIFKLKDDLKQTYSVSKAVQIDTNFNSN